MASMMKEFLLLYLPLVLTGFAFFAMTADIHFPKKTFRYSTAGRFYHGCLYGVMIGLSLVLGMLL